MLRTSRTVVPPPWTTRTKPAACEALEGLADRVPVDGEGDGELALGRQRVTGSEPPGEHGVAQLGEDLVGHRPRAVWTALAHDDEDDTGASTHQEVGPVLSRWL